MLQAEKDAMQASQTKAIADADAANATVIAAELRATKAKTDVLPVTPTPPSTGGESVQGATCTPENGNVMIGGEAWTINSVRYLRRDSLKLPQTWAAAQSVAETLLIWDHVLWYWEANHTDVSQWWRTIDHLTGAVGPTSADPRGTTTVPPVDPPPIDPPGPTTIDVVATERGTIDTARAKVSDTLVVLPIRKAVNEYNGGAPTGCMLFAEVCGVKGKKPIFRLTGGLEGIGPGMTIYYTATPNTVLSWKPLAQLWDVNGALEVKPPSAFVDDTIFLSHSACMRPSDWAAYLATLGSLWTVTPFSSAPKTTAQANELGKPIPAMPLQIARIGTGAKKIVWICGAHGYEDLGDITMLGAMKRIESDAAMGTRATWFFLPQTNKPGRYGGHWRGNWQPAKELYDPNRHWTTVPDALECVVLARNLILSATGSKFDAFIDSHNNPSNRSLYCGGVRRQEFIAKWQPYGHGGPVDNNIPSMASHWAEQYAKVGACTELGLESATSAMAYGASIAQSLDEMVVAGQL